MCSLPVLCFMSDVLFFTVTRQALGSLLRAERPDVEERRTQMLQLQGEQNVKVTMLQLSSLVRYGAGSRSMRWLLNAEKVLYSRVVHESDVDLVLRIRFN